MLPETEDVSPLESPESQSQYPTGFGWLFWVCKTFFSDERNVSFAIACLSVIVVIFLLCARYMFANSVSTLDITPRDVYATKRLQVADIEETQRLRYEARQNVLPHYIKEVGVDKVILDNMVELLQDIQAIRHNTTMTPADKYNAVLKLLNNNESIRPETVIAILNTAQWQKLYDTALWVTDHLVSKGITSEEFRTKLVPNIEQTIPPESGLSKPEESALISIVASRMRPTVVIDEKTTEELRDISASHVLPVIQHYAKGDLIVRKGEKLNPVQRKAMEQQGSLFSQNLLWLSLGIALLSISLLSIVWTNLYRFEQHRFFKPAYASLISTAIITVVGALSLLVHLQFNISRDVFPFTYIALTLCVYSQALILCIFTHPKIAILNTMMVLLLCGLALQIPLDALSVMVISSLVGISVLARKPIPKDRSDIILAGLAVGITQIIIVWAINLVYEPVNSTEQFNFLSELLSGVSTGILTGCLSMGMLILVEKTFKLLTPYTLLELGNHDRPMLRRLQLEAPGTFHHSVMVATLSEAAAEAIGANPILTRVGALYHDIGKVKRPLFFVENQAYFGVENPHEKLTPRLSKMVITAHPRDGIEMGKHLGLPKAILRFMPEHHGTLIAGYFYNKAVLEEGEENVNKAQFRYPGPKPQSRETAIVMMADACESAVRALKTPTVAQVEERVDKIIKQRIDDGQFSECSLTFQDIQVVRDTFVRILRGIQHSRIEYQQNVLEELGKKPILDALKPMSRVLAKTEHSVSNGVATVNGINGINAGASQVESLLTKPDDTPSNPQDIGPPECC